MISQPVAMTLLSPVAGKLSDIKNPGVIASIGMGMTAIRTDFTLLRQRYNARLPYRFASDLDGNRFWSVLLTKLKCDYEFC